MGEREGKRRGEGEERADFDVCANAKLSPDSRRAGVRRSARTRIGKIARLPNEIREQLNRRLQDGEEGHKLLDWLNALPQAQKMLSAKFGGRPISKQNLSEWRQGGYRDWVRAEEDRLRVDRLTEQAAQLAVPDGESPLSERLAAVLLVQLAGVLEELQDDSLPPAERWQLLRQMLREVAQARREDNRAAKLRIEQDRWEWERERMDEERTQRADAEEKEELCAPIKAAFIDFPMLMQAFGGGEQGRDAAAQILEIQHDLKPGTLYRRKPSNPVKHGQSEVGADGSDSSVRSNKSGKSAKAPKRRRSRSRRVKPSQTSPTKETLPQDPAPASAVEPPPQANTIQEEPGTDTPSPGA